ELTASKLVGVRLLLRRPGLRLDPRRAVGRCQCVVRRTEWCEPSEEAEMARRRRRRPVGCLLTQMQEKRLADRAEDEVHRTLRHHVARGVPWCAAEVRDHAVIRELA